MSHNPEHLEHKRHTLAHLLALAVRRDFPHALPTIGPATDNGFYYDFDFSGGNAPTDADLKQIEKNMKKALSSWKAFSHHTVTADEAREKFKGNKYKTELINELENKGETITLYSVGEGHFEYTDLCRGGHSASPAEDIDTDAFKLTSLAGAYWRGSEKNTMLTRIYGIAFDTKEQLDTHLTQLDEAKKRDHRKLGVEMKLFTLSPLVGSGLPLLQPNGAIIRRELEEYLWNLHKGKGYQRVWTPHIAKEGLYETSGHAAKFGDELFRVKGKEESFILKPMNCPHHMQIFADNQFSYRDMPVRYFEPATVYRDEKTGQLSGLTRVRSITQDDGHLFCRSSQINDEVTIIVGIIREFYKTMNLLDGYWVRLSVRGEGGQYIGDDAVWQTAELALENAAQNEGLNYKRVEGEAAFYGPKLDFMFKDAIGRECQLATIQCDFNLPERFGLSFINEKGEKERPVVIHRAISGSLERFMGVMIEHFGGNFPLWLAPDQIRIIPVADTHADYAKQIHTELSAIGIRASIDVSNESMGKKIRNAKKERLPYFVVVGDKEVAEKTITLEWRKGDSKNMTLESLGNHLLAEIETKKIA